ncbi:MAG TPA: tryptophan--tRNA ligase [Patescibacteria group bacterium]|nr:tryptophan--tRNA ligase [Patescibacteria group bacterium]
MKKTILTGFQPTGAIHIGNYLAVMAGIRQQQEQYDCYFFIADWHSLTVDYKVEEKRAMIKDLIAILLASGLDPEKCVFFRQSDILEHAELAWYFNCVTPISFLERMTQYKDKAAKNVKNINAGLMLYPVLMAADILMYDSDLIPVGVDQVQHIELARDTAKFFNNRFGETFKAPEPLLTDMPKIMSLTEPTKKMSKSDNPKSAILVADEPEVIMEKIKKATADEVGISNLLGLGKKFIKNFDAADYKDNNLKLKTELAQGLADYFAEIREKRKEWLTKDAEIEKILAKGAEKARSIAQKKMDDVRRKVGLK